MQFKIFFGLSSFPLFTSVGFKIVGDSGVFNGDDILQQSVYEKDLSALSFRLGLLWKDNEVEDRDKDEAAEVDGTTGEALLRSLITLLVELLIGC